MPTLSELMAQSAPQRGTIKLSDLTQQKPYQASDDMSGLEQMLAMYGRGVAELGQGVKQGALHVGGALGLADPSTVSDYDAQIKDEAQLYNKDLGQKTGGSVLPMAAQLITTAPAGMAETAAVKGLPFIKQLLSSVGMGAGMGAVQPVTDVKPEKNLSDLITGNQPEGEDYLTTKLAQVGLGGVLGGGANALGKTLGLGIDAARNPTAAIMNPVLKRGNATPFAKESEALAQETGVNFTPGQVSGSPSATMAENMARQSIFSRDIAQTGDQARTQAAFDYYQKILDGVSKSGASPDIAGKQVQGAAGSLISTLKKAQSDAAAQDFGAVRAMTKGQAAIDPTNTGGFLQKLLADNEGMGTPGADALANFAKRQLSNVDPRIAAAAKELGGEQGAALAKANEASAPAQGNLDKIMGLRSYLSKVAGGQAKISGENQDRMIATQMLKAIDTDIDSSAQQIGGDLGGALSQANKRYRDFSQQIDSVHASPLGSILGEDVAGAFQSGSFNTVAPEKVISKLSGLQPTELGVVRGLMEKQQPEAWQTFKRAYLEQALDKAMQMPPSAGANTAIMRPSVLVKNLGDAKKLNAIFDPGEVSQLNNMFGVAKRLSDTTGYNFSGTAPANEALGLMNSIAGGGVKAALKIGSTALGSRQLAKIMTDADGRAALLKLQKLPPQSAQARQLTAWLAANYGAEEP